MRLLGVGEGGGVVGGGVTRMERENGIAVENLFSADSTNERKWDTKTVILRFNSS